MGKTVKPVCAWSGEEIGADDETVDTVDGTVLLSVFEEEGCEDIHGNLRRMDDCVWYEHRDAYVESGEWDSDSVEALDGNDYLADDCEEYRTWDRETVYVPDGSHLSEYEYSTCYECGRAVSYNDEVYSERHEATFCPDHAPSEDGEDGVMGWDESPLDHGRPLTAKGFGDLDSAVPFMGVELECESDNRADCVEHVHGLRVRKTQFAICKHDGSLDDACGFEICTVPATLEVHREVWPKLTSALSKLGANSYDNTGGRCGLHVHVSKRAFASNLHIARFCHLIGDPANKQLSECIAQRGGSNYAQMRDKKRKVRAEAVQGLPDMRIRYLGTGEAHPCGSANSPFVYELGQSDGRANRYSVYQSDEFREIPVVSPTIAGYVLDTGLHYDAATPTDHGTVEVRIYKGTLHRTGVLRALEHVDSARRFTLECGANDAYSAPYLAWLVRHRSEYMELCRFLWRKSPAYRQAVRDANLSSGQVLPMVTDNQEERECA